jgi:hypothetical protein
MGRRNCSRGTQACTGAALGRMKVEARVEGPEVCAWVDRFCQILKPDHSREGFERFKAASGLVRRY